MTEVEVLDKMVQRLQDKGWIQGVICEDGFICEDEFIPPDCLFPLKNVKGKACLLGTAELCSSSLGDFVSISAIGDRLAAVIAELFPDRKEGTGHWATVIKFNDHPDTTFEDVMLVVKHARTGG